MNIRMNFGARLDKNTLEFVSEAKKRGLNTDEMELLMEKTVPTELIETSKNEDGFLSMGIGKCYGSEYCLQTLLSPNFIFSSNKKECKFYPHEINQETLDTITSNLKTLQKNESLQIYPALYIAEMKRRYGKTIDF